MMTIVTHVRVKAGHEPAWDAALRSRIETAKSQPGFVSVQLCAPLDAMNERVIIGTWETRADWEAWHGTPEFQQTRQELEEPESKTRQESWHEVLLAEQRSANASG
jgi:heme-degrading monooxygenase HmoA